MRDRALAQDGAATAVLSDMSAGAITLGSNGTGTLSMPQMPNASSDPMLDNLARDVSHGPRDRLSKIVELDPDRAVEVLKQWLNDPAERAT
jgi:flagellar biosynthesis/type III secretory pathway M-ring protein FliF/YscJ